jgi:glycosyltransferase involved in cell wall biosynthesis
MRSAAPVGAAVGDARETGPIGVTVCICTYKRPEQLSRLLAGLARQDTAGRFRHSIVVADNDRAESARAVVTRFRATSPLAVTYCVEPEQNIARVRNRALAHASGDFVAFIDDDEFPEDDWLVRMLDGCARFEAAGVLGPVRPFFAETPPAWLVRSRLCERPEHPTGTALHWRHTRTGNVLFHRRILDAHEPPFRPEFPNGGEDVDFFRRMMERGHRFVWCNEAPVYEEVPPERRRRRYFLKRALLRGQNERLLLSATSVAKSLVAVPLYVAALPLACVLGQHAVMQCGVRLCDHAGKLLGAVGIRPAGEKYING